MEVLGERESVVENLCGVMPLTTAVCLTATQHLKNRASGYKSRRDFIHFCLVLLHHTDSRKIVCSCSSDSLPQCKILSSLCFCVPGADCVQVRQRVEGHHKPLPAQENEGRREGQPLVA